MSRPRQCLGYAQEVRREGLVIVKPQMKPEQLLVLLTPPAYECLWLCVLHKVDQPDLDRYTVEDPIDQPSWAEEAPFLLNRTGIFLQDFLTWDASRRSLYALAGYGDNDLQEPSPSPYGSFGRFTTIVIHVDEVEKAMSTLVSIPMNRLQLLDLSRSVFPLLFRALCGGGIAAHTRFLVITNMSLDNANPAAELHRGSIYTHISCLRFCGYQEIPLLSDHVWDWRVIHDDVVRRFARIAAAWEHCSPSFPFPLNVLFHEVSE